MMTDTPRRIQLRRAKGWRMPAGAVYVGRPTTWGNPFEVWRDDISFVPPRWTVSAWSCHWEQPDRANAIRAAVDLYRAWTQGDGPHTSRYAAEGYRREAMHHLRGRDLACWCPLDHPCHADVLLELANAPLRCEAV